MNRGISLVELLISLTISSTLILVLYGMYSFFMKDYILSRDSWYCMQSLRNAFIHIDADFKQRACLMPQDLSIAVKNGSLFISGIPVTSSHSGIKLSENAQPPYFSVIRSSSKEGVTLDRVDIDADGTDDYWEDLGVITDSGPYVISGRYSRGRLSIPLTPKPDVRQGDRIVPAVHYELKNDGLYRNAQLLAEAVIGFDVEVSGQNVNISLKAGHHGREKTISYTYSLY